MAEKHVQSAVVDYLRVRGIVPVAVPNGSVLAGDSKQRAMQMNALKRAGLHVGFPDLIAYHHSGQIGHIEIKDEGSKFNNDNQIACRDWLVNLGHRHAVVRSIDDMAETLAEWGWA